MMTEDLGFVQLDTSKLTCSYIVPHPAFSSSRDTFLPKKSEAGSIRGGRWTCATFVKVENQAQDLARRYSRYANTDRVEVIDNKPFCLEVSPAAMLNSQQHMAGLVYRNGLPEGCKLIRRTF
jgi:hypothetical protein